MPLMEYSPLEGTMARADAARLAPLVRAEDPEMAPDLSKQISAGGLTGEDEFLSVGELRRQYTDYLDSKVDEIEEQKDARRYYHGAQLDSKQIEVLRRRHQPIQIWNRIKRKVNGIAGLCIRMRGDPKAQGRNPKSEAGSSIATQSIRYVLDASEFKDSIEMWELLQGGIEGTSGAQLVLQKGDKGDPDIGVHMVIGDEYFYDPRSYRFDFLDNRYEGIAKWLDLGAGQEMFPEKAEELEGLFQGDSDLTTNPDREIRWLISSERRIRLVEHWYKHKGQWKWAFYCSNVLLDQGISPFKNDKGETESSFVMWAANIDQDGDRYGFVRDFKGPQDALNQGKSKTLALANSRRIYARKNAVDDVERTRTEAARHDGFVEFNAGVELGKDLKIDDTHPDIATFSAFTDDAKNELDGYANANLAAISGAGLNNLSGKAIELLRQPGMAEIAPFIVSHRSFKLRMYRKIWNAVQRHWSGERWIRVNSNDKLAQFIQLNGLDVDEWGRPTIVNHVGSLDVNIIVDEGPDIVTMLQELADKLAKYPPGTFPPQVLIEMDPNIPRDEKDRLLQMMAPKPEQQAVQQAMLKSELEGRAAKNAKTAAEVQRTLQQAEQAAATAQEKRAKSTESAARAGHLAHVAHLDAAEFVRDSLLEAHKVLQPFLGPPQAAQPPAPIGPAP